MVLLIDLFTYVIGIVSIRYILNYNYIDLIESFSLIYLLKFINKRLIRKLHINS